MNHRSIRPHRAAARGSASVSSWPQSPGSVSLLSPAPDGPLDAPERARREAAFRDALADRLPGLDRSRVRADVPLAPFTTFKVGGPAEVFFEAHSADELAEAVGAAREVGVPFFLLGLGANILVGDGGFPGVVIRNRADRLDLDAETGRVWAESGAIVWPGLIEATLAAGLSGVEHYAGIPSTVGGALWQNLHFLSPPPERERTMFIEEVVESAVLLGTDGTLHLIGLYEDQDLALPSGKIQRRRILGGYYGCTIGLASYRRAMSLLASGGVQAERMTTHRFPFTDAGEAFDLLWNQPGEALRLGSRGSS